jgi:fructose-bisphosphate aldolase class I
MLLTMTTPLPHDLAAFSFGRVLVSEALGVWAGVPDQAIAAQQALLGNCRRAARTTR